MDLYQILEKDDFLFNNFFNFFKQKFTEFINFVFKDLDFSKISIQNVFHNWFKNQADIEIEANVLTMSLNYALIMTLTYSMNYSKISLKSFFVLEYFDDFFDSNGRIFLETQHVILTMIMKKHPKKQMSRKKKNQVKKSLKKAEKISFSTFKFLEI